mgnify:CR=1 FL=1
MKGQGRSELFQNLNFSRLLSRKHLFWYSDYLGEWVDHAGVYIRIDTSNLCLIRKISCRLEDGRFMGANIDLWVLPLLTCGGRNIKEISGELCYVIQRFSCLMVWFLLLEIRLVNKFIHLWKKWSVLSNKHTIFSIWNSTKAQYCKIQGVILWFWRIIPVVVSIYVV